MTPILQPFIQNIWVMQAEAGMFQQPERLVPDGQIELLLNYGDPFTKFSSTDFSNPSIYKGSQLIGQRNTYYFTATKGKVDLISISFKPGGLSPFVSFPIVDITATSISLQLLPDFLFSEIEERIYELKNINEKIVLIQNILLEKLRINSDKHNKLYEFVPLVQSIHQYSSITHFLENHTINKRKLEREFDRHVGVSPKFLQRLMRLKKTVSIFYQSRIKNLTGLAYECGFFDQSHFINDFKQLTGLSPKNYFFDCSSAFSNMKEA